jgi:flagellar hook-length control protein FliK
MHFLEEGDGPLLANPLDRVHRERPPVFSVTSDVAASASYSSAPPKFVPPEPSLANDNFASLLDSNTPADNTGSAPPAPEPPAPQRSSNDASQASANQPSPGAGPANQAPQPSNSNNAGDNAAQPDDSNAGAASTNGNANAAQSTSAKSTSTPSGGKSTDKASADKGSANSADPTTAPQQGGTPVAIPNAIATLIAVNVTPADTPAPAAAAAASNPNAPLAIAAAAIAASSSTAAALAASTTATVKANSTSETGSSASSANGAAANAKPVVQTAIATPVKALTTPTDATSTNDAVVLATSGGTPSPIGAKTAAADAQVPAQAKNSVPGTAAATSDPTASTAATANSDAAPQPATAGKQDGLATPTEAVKADGSNAAPATGAASPSSHDRSAIAAAGQVSTAAPDASAQAAATLPQQLSTSATTASINTLTATPATGGAVPVSGLAVEIAASVQNGRTHFEVRLDPADLGRIDVRIDVDRNGQVTSHLTVEKPETLSMLRQDAPQLQQALNDAGLKSGSGGLQFSLRDQSSSGQNSGNQSGGNAQRLIVSDETATPSVAAGQSYGRLLGSSSGVDIRV